MIKNIIFDLGGVLLDIDYNLTRDAFGAIGVERFDEMYSQFSANKLFENLETGHITVPDFYRHIQSHYPMLTNDEIKNAWNAMLISHRLEALPLLSLLKQHYRVFLFSNTNEIHLAAVRDMYKEESGREDFDSYFEKAWYSHEIGYRKPYAEAFEFVLKDAGLQPEETLFIDDSYPNIEGAKKAGIKTYLFPLQERINNMFEEGKLKANYLTSS